MTSPLTISTDVGVESVKVTTANGSSVDLTSIVEGTEITATVELKEHYVLKTVTFNGSILPFEVNQTSFDFTMPDHGATFAVTTDLPESTIVIENNEESGTVTLSVIDDGVMTPSSGEVIIGQTARIEVTPLSDDIKVEALIIDGAEIPYTGAYDFEVKQASHKVEVIYSYKVDLIEYFNYRHIFAAPVLKANDLEVKSGSYIRQESLLTMTFTVSLTSYDVANNYEGLYFYENGVGRHAREDEFHPVSSSNDYYTYTIDSLIAPLALGVEYNYGYDNSTSYALDVQIEHAEIYGYLEGDTFGYNSSYFTIVREKGYTYSASVVDSSGNEIANTTLNSFNGASMTQLRVNSLNASGTLKITATEAECYDITYENREAVTSKERDVILGDFAVVGENVYVDYLTTLDPNANTIRGMTFEGVTPRYNSTNFVNTYYNFDMPANDVKISFTLVDNIPIIITEDADLETVLLSGTPRTYSPIRTAAPGTTIYVQALAKDGYAIIGGEATTNEDTVSGSLSTATIGGVTYTVISFSIPVNATSFTITLDLIEMRTITVEGFDTAYFSDTSFRLNGVYITAANNVVNVPPEQSVSYNLSIRNDINTHYIYSIVLDDGATEQSLYTSGENDIRTSVSSTFEMPNDDVIFRVEVRSKPTADVDINFVGNDTEVVSYEFLRTTDSTVLSGTGTLNGVIPFYTGEYFRARITVNTGYTVEFSYTAGNITNLISPSEILNGRYTFELDVLPHNISAFLIYIGVDTPLSSEIDNQTGDNISLTYTVNGEAATSLDGVYYGSTIGVTVATTAPTGYGYRVSIVDTATGNELGYGVPTATATVNAAFKVVITKVEPFNVTISLSLAEQSSRSTFSISLRPEEGSAFASLYTPSTSSVTTAFECDFYAWVGYSGNYKYDITLAIGGETVLEKTNLTGNYDGDYNYVTNTHPTYKLDGDVVFTVIEHQ